MEINRKTLDRKSRSDLVDLCLQFHNDYVAMMDEAEKLRCENAEFQVKVLDLEEVLDSKRKNIRELDVAIHGEDSAAKQPALCDLIGDVRQLNLEYRVRGAHIAELEQALSRIAYPIWWGQEDAKRDGCKVDGHALVALSNDPAYLMGIAKKVCPEPPKTSTEP